MPDANAIRAFLDESHLRLAERVTAYARDHVATRPHGADDAAARTEARALLAELGGAGWFAPIETRDYRACALVREALAAASPLADAVFALQALGTTPILLSDNDEMKRAWVAKAMGGRAMAAFAMTEPDAGSDVASMTTSATRDGDEYVLEGTKTFISNAGIADFYTVFATTDASRGSRGISCFVVPADRVTFVRPLVMSEPHPIGEIRFDACRVPVSHRLGAEGEGFKLGLKTLDRLRATVGAAACGMGERAFEEALRHALARKQFGKPLAEHQLVQEKLARMTMNLRAARLLVYQAVWESDQGKERVSEEAAIAKAFATEAAQRIVDDAVQILGGRGVLAEHPVDRLYRAVRALRIYEGTTEIQHLIIAGHRIADASGTS
jgi:acyl-CoA dehydrogenase